MPRILLVKTSSMGDVIHNLPIVTDIRRQFPDTVIDWVVEESLERIPLLHPAIRNAIPVALRRWRKLPTNTAIRRQMVAFAATLRAETYDVVLDTQGLIKSALIAKLARGARYGYAWDSAREPLACWFYRHRFSIDKTLHAVERNRLLAAQALGYTLERLPLDYGIKAPAGPSSQLPGKPYAVLLHATSRDDKLWPETNWIALGKWLLDAGLDCRLPWGNPAEKARSERLTEAIPNARVAERLTLDEAATLLAGAAIVIGVDTGLTHFAAALGVNVIALYVATAPGLTGVYGKKNAINLGGTGKPPAVKDVCQTALQLIDGV